DDDEKQIERLIHLVDDMLDVSRIGARKLALELQEFDLCDLVREVVPRFAPQLESARCEISLELSGPVVGHWDFHRIEHVMTNLLTNAMKYGAGRPIQIRTASADGIAKLVIQDQGIGIAQKDQERIFRQFERAVSRSSFSGFGLGLYIAHQIVD